LGYCIEVKIATELGLEVQARLHKALEGLEKVISDGTIGGRLAVGLELEQHAESLYDL
jgi:hypothetical protein